MSLELKTPTEVDGLTLVLPQRLTESFEIADRQLRDFYGQSPGVEALIRLWLACPSPSRVRREFELAVLDIRKSNLTPNEEGDFNEDCL
jgi:hypothetical protein